MPIVRVEMWPGRTHEQKSELARAITDAVVNIAKTTPEETIVVFTGRGRRRTGAQVGSARLRRVSHASIVLTLASRSGRVAASADRGLSGHVALVTRLARR